MFQFLSFTVLFDMFELLISGFANDTFCVDCRWWCVVIWQVNLLAPEVGVIRHWACWLRSLWNFWEMHLMGSV